MRISLQTDTNQYALSRVQLGPMRTDTTGTDQYELIRHGMDQCDLKAHTQV